ncbi:DUF4366 domain-containing protein [Butyrivibrio sp. XPD2002]|uniref:DUF4366 domain-containing protein n=1 Tax=Butyrivibrio sp. XPD2002 TaxID=1280665 RepID=UPI00041B5EFA|nr:DUF4366 domain-containing protein [Butyrivibrio sp. XPD2002]
MKLKTKILILGAAVFALTAFCITGNNITAKAFVDPEAVEAEEEKPDPPVEEPEEEMGPLTPEGNLTIVDDYGSPEKSGKQFITVTTKNGNIFYIIIDRDDQGENTVHFLNLVDERDILSLLDEDEIKELKGETDEEVTPAPVVEEPKEEEPEPEPEEPKKGGSKAALIVILILMAGAGGFYIYSNKDEFIKKEKEDPDEDFQEEEEKSVLDSMPEEHEDSEE